MAIGFIPKHIEEISLNDLHLTQEQFVFLAKEALDKMQCKLSYIGKNGIIAYTNNGILSWNAELKIIIENSVVRIQSESTGREMIDWGKNKTNVNRFKLKVEKLLKNFDKEDLENKSQLLSKSFSQNEDDNVSLSPLTKKEQLKGFLSIFKPTNNYFITPILLNINILIFTLMALSGTNILMPDNESLLNWGANFKPLTLENEWWRLLTNCFLHIGIFHLLMNMYALLYIGLLLEPYLGKARFLSAYLLTGISASVASLWWHDITISAGASGAIFGMYGVFISLLTTNIIEKNARKALLTSISIFVGYNLIYGLKGGIDNAAHIGGLISGLVIGYLLVPSILKFSTAKFKYISISFISIIIIFSSFVIYTKLPNDIGVYDQRMKGFVSMEEKALNVYKLQNASDEEILSEIRNNGLYYWNKNIELIDSFQELNLPIEIRVRNSKLKEYCELRIKSYELIYKAIDENTDQYEFEINGYTQKIEKLISELTNN